MISHNEQGLRGSIADRYVDHKRSELLSTIVDLELVSHVLVHVHVHVQSNLNYPNLDYPYHRLSELWSQAKCTG